MGATYSILGNPDFGFEDLSQSPPRIIFGMEATGVQSGYYDVIGTNYFVNSEYMNVSLFDASVPGQTRLIRTIEPYHHVGSTIPFGVSRMKVVFY